MTNAISYYSIHEIIGAAESAALIPTAWERWADTVEGILGHSLDGDQVTDGYSMDMAYTMWERGISPQQAAAMCTQGPIRPGALVEHIDHATWGTRRVHSVDGANMLLANLHGAPVGPVPIADYRVIARAGVSA